MAWPARLVLAAAAQVLVAADTGCLTPKAYDPYAWMTYMTCIGQNGPNCSNAPPEVSAGIDLCTASMKCEEDVGRMTGYGLYLGQLKYFCPKMCGLCTTVGNITKPAAAPGANSEEEPAAEPTLKVVLGFAYLVLLMLGLCLGKQLLRSRHVIRRALRKCLFGLGPAEQPEQECDVCGTTCETHARLVSAALAKHWRRIAVLVAALLLVQDLIWLTGIAVRGAHPCGSVFKGELLHLVLVRFGGVIVSGLVLAVSFHRLPSAALVMVMVSCQVCLMFYGMALEKEQALLSPSRFLPNLVARVLLGLCTSPLLAAGWHVAYSVAECVLFLFVVPEGIVFLMPAHGWVFVGQTCAEVMPGLNVQEHLQQQFQTIPAGNPEERAKLNQLSHVLSKGMISFGSFAYEEVLLCISGVLIVSAVNYVMAHESEGSLHLQNMENLLRAFSNIMATLCDAVVHVSHDFQILDPAPQLAALLHRPSARHALKGTPFLAHLASDGDRAALTAALQAADGAKQGLAGRNEVLPVTLRDVMNTPFRAHIFHTCFRGLDGEPRYVLGLNEVSEPLPESEDHWQAAGCREQRRGPPDVAEAETPPAQAQDGASAGSGSSFWEIDFLGIGDAVASFDLGSDFFTILGCNAAFMNVSDEQPVGQELLRWVEDPDRLRKEIQNVCNDMFNRGHKSFSTSMGLATLHTPTARQAGMQLLAQLHVRLHVRRPNDDPHAPWPAQAVFTQMQRRRWRQRGNRVTSPARAPACAPARVPARAPPQQAEGQPGAATVGRTSL